VIEVSSRLAAMNPAAKRTESPGRKKDSGLDEDEEEEGQINEERSGLDQDPFRPFRDGGERNR
jgi:hypothetical protein